MKKSILFIPILISLSIIGCTKNYSQQSSDNVINQASLNIDKLINTNATDIENAKKEFIGKPISDFNNAYKLKSANFVASTINESDTLYFYPLVNHDVIHKDQYKHPNYSCN